MNIQIQTPMTESEYGAAMRALAKKEGHTPRNTISGRPPEQNVTPLLYDIMNICPITNSKDAAKKLNIRPESLRNGISTAKANGWLKKLNNPTRGSRQFAHHGLTELGAEKLSEAHRVYTGYYSTASGKYRLRNTLILEFPITDIPGTAEKLGREYVNVKHGIRNLRVNGFIEYDPWSGDPDKPANAQNRRAYQLTAKGEQIKRKILAEIERATK